jgi:hypothetical protein
MAASSGAPIEGRDADERRWRGRAQALAVGSWVVEGARDQLLRRGAMPGQMFSAGAMAARDVAIVTRAVWGRGVRLAIVGWFVPGVGGDSVASGIPDAATRGRPAARPSADARRSASAAR